MDKPPTAMEEAEVNFMLAMLWSFTAGTCFAIALLMVFQ